MLNLSRPNFFPGQWFDYRDFNRLSAQADTVTSLLNRYLLKGGGIVCGGLDEFSIEPAEGMNLIVRPGIGILPNGQPLVLREERIVSLKDLMAGSRPKNVIIAARNCVQGQDKYQDPEDASITGFRSEALVCEIFLSSKELPEDAIELCRVLLDPTSSRLRLARSDEEWSVQMQDAQDSIVDLRMRRLIVPQTLVPFDCYQLIAFRQSLYAIEEGIRKLEKLFLVKDRFSSHLFLSMLHAEVLSVPYQPNKVGFLSSEFARALSLYLEEILRNSGSQRENLDEKRMMDCIQMLGTLRLRTVRPGAPSFKTILEVSASLQEVVRRADEKYSLLDNVNEALTDLQHCRIQLGNKLSLAGFLFQKVHEVEAFNTANVSVESEASHERTVSTSFQSGESETRSGVFIGRGAFQLDVRCTSTEQPLVVVLPQYVRRAGSVVHYEVNGKHLSTAVHEDPRVSNVWINRGLTIPKEMLVPNTNRITIRVEKADLDFGFFGCAAYQPTRMTDEEVAQ